jgi:hypothetical protein
MKNSLIKFSTLLLIILIFCVPVTAQKKKYDPFAAIPVKSKSRFKYRWRTYLKLMRAAKYSKAYDMLARKAFLNHVRPTRSEFVKMMKEEIFITSHLLDLYPIATAYIKDLKAYEVDCETRETRQGRPNNIFDTMVYAWYEKGDWYFSPFLERIDSSRNQSLLQEESILFFK